jgi:hypothetical protein
VQVDISVVISLVTGAVTLGIALGKLHGHTERLKALERFRDRCGERLQVLETDRKVARAERKLTSGGGVKTTGG